MLALCFVGYPSSAAHAQSNDWVRSRGTIPAGAVSGGSEDDGRETYICRVSYGGSYLAGKALDDRCYYNSGSREVSATRFDVLVGMGYTWRRTSSRTKAVVVGGAEEENFYVCRASQGGGIYPGRTDGNRCYYTRNNRDESSGRFEILESSRRRSDLLDAASSGDYRETIEALRDGQAVDQRDSNGRTALMLAAAGGYENVVRELITERADPDARDEAGNTAMILAASKGRSGVVELLFRAGADHRIQNNEGDNAFVAASSGGHRNVMEVFLDDPRFGGIDIVDQQKALDRSAASGREGIVRLLVERGLNPDTRGPFGRTPVMQAALGGHADTVRYLLSRDVSINTRDESGLSPFICAVLSDSENTLKVFMEENKLILKEDDEAAEGLRTAAQKDKRDSMKYLLGRGVDVDAASTLDGRTPIMLSAVEGNADATEILIRYQANLNLKDLDGRTALMLAAAESKRNTTKLLIQAGAILDMRDNNGTTALGWAIRNGHKDTRKELQKAGAKQ